MKKKIALLMAALSAMNVFCTEIFRQLEFYEGFEYKAKIDDTPQLNTDDGQETDEKTKNVMSAKLSLKHASFFASAKGEGKELFSSINKGASIHTETLFDAYRIYALGGNITYSGAASRLKTPKLTFGSSLKKFSLPKQGLEPSLPTRTSSAKNDSACIKLVPQKDTLPQIEAAYISNGTLIANSSYEFSTQHIPLLQAGITAGAFTNGKGTSSWFDKIPRFKESYYPAAELTVSAVTQPLRATCTVAAYKTPFDTSTLFPRTAFCSRMQASFISGLFSLSADVFASSSAFITADGTYCHTPLQFSLNPQRIFPFKDYVVRAGVLGAVTLETASFFSNGLCPSYRLRADLSVMRNSSSFVLYSVYSSSFTDDDSPADESLAFCGKFSAKQKAFSWAVNAKASFSDLVHSLGTQSYSAGTGFSFNRGIVTSAAAAASVTVKNGSFSRGSFSADMVIGSRSAGGSKKGKNAFKKLKFTVKTGISLTF